MILAASKTLLICLVTVAILVFAAPLSAQVYKVVDEDGNVSYTDQAPTDGAKQVDLPPLSVIEAPIYEQPKAAKEATEGEQPKEMSLQYLRKNYADFAIVAPQPDETVWGSDAVVTTAWNVGYELQEGMSVTIYLDGKVHTTTTEQIIALPNMDRGEHTIKMELKNSKRRIVASAGPVTFFLRRPGLYNRARRGSG